MKIRTGCVVAIVGLAYSLSPAFAGDDRVPVLPAPIVAVGEVNAARLYLRTGEVDTALARPLAEAAGFAGRHVVIQLDGPMSPARRAGLEAAGVRLMGYLPMHAFIARLDGADLDAVAALGIVRWWSEYLPSWKVDPSIGQRPFQTPERMGLLGQGRLRVSITIFEDEPVAQAMRLIGAIRGTAILDAREVGESWVLHAEMDAARVRDLAGLEAVQFVEDASEVTYRNSTTRWIVQSNVNNSTPLYDQGLRGEGQVVGVIDGLPDRNHCSLKDVINPGPNHRKIIAYNGNFSSDSHGTHVSGTSVGDNGVNDHTRGIAYLAKMTCAGIPSFTENAINTALSLHHTQTARLHTNSWGDDGTTQYNGLCRGFDVFQYNNEDSLVMLAVTNTSTLKNPENAKNLLAVGASQDTPNQGSHCTGGTGPTSDGRRKPEIYAPGCSTNSAQAGTPCGIVAFTGTSMACPAVTGACALIRQYYTDGFYPAGIMIPSQGFTPTGALIKASALNSAVDMTGITGYPSNSEGWGRILADNVTYFQGDTRKLVVADVRNAQGLSTGEEVIVPVTVLGGGEQLRVTVAWTEPAATLPTSFAAVNDLDVEVISPTGTLYKGNVFSGGVSVPGGNKDDRNNVEQVHVSNPTPGAWTVKVKGAGVQVGKQGYAVVVTGDVSSGPVPLTIQLVGTIPQYVAPGQATSFDVNILPGDDTYLAGSAKIHYRLAGGSYLAADLTHLGGDTYRGTLPAAACGDFPEFYFSAEGLDTGTTNLPFQGAGAPFSMVVAVPETFLDDDFDTNQGWTVTNDASLTDGAWEVGVPAGDGTRFDPPQAFGGSGGCWLTANRPGNSDVDGGPTRLTSPAWDLSAWGDVKISYARWIKCDDNDLDDLKVLVSNNNGSTWTLVESSRHEAAGWVQRSFNLKEFVTPSAQVRLRFETIDNPNNSITEAAVDALKIEGFACVNTCAPDCEGDGDLDVFDFLCFQNLFALQDPYGDWEQDGDWDVFDFLAFQNSYALGCP